MCVSTAAKRLREAANSNDIDTGMNSEVGAVKCLAGGVKGDQFCVFLFFFSSKAPAR